MSLEEILRNKKLLQVAAEIAGKGIGKTPEVLGGYGTDEQENIAPVPQAAEQEPVQVTEEIVEFVLEKLKSIEESTGIELADRDLDFAIKTIVEGALQNLTEKDDSSSDEEVKMPPTAFYPGPGQMPRSLPTSPPVGHQKGGRWGKDKAAIRHDEKLGRDMRSKPGARVSSEELGLLRDGSYRTRDELRRDADIARGQKEVEKRQAARERRYEYEDRQEPVSRRDQQRVTTALRRNKDLFAGKSPDEVEKIMKNNDFGY